MKPVTNQVAHPITLTNTSINYKAPAASKLSQLIPVPISLDTPLAKKLLKSLGNAMQYNYNMDSYYNFLSENYVITILYML
jgi:replication-associated recombination protein RarA